MPQGSHESAGEIHKEQCLDRTMSLSSFFSFQMPLRNWEAYKMGEAANCISFFGTCLLFVLIKVTRGNDTGKQCPLFHSYLTPGL